MSKRKRNKKTTSGGVVDGDEEGGQPSKRLQLVAKGAQGQLRLTEDQEDRLGRLGSSIQWIIKIAQDRGCNACLALSSVRDAQLKQDTFKATFSTFDGQEVVLLVGGVWVEDAAEVMGRVGKGQVILVSGLGARIPPSGSQVNFEAGKIIMEVLDAKTHITYGCLEIAEGKIVTKPELSDLQKVEPTSPVVDSHIDGTKSASHSRQSTVSEASLAEGGRQSLMSSVVTPQAVRNDVLSSSLHTPRHTVDPMRHSTSTTPGWLTTPAPNAVASSSLESPTKEVPKSVSVAPAPAKTSQVEEKNIGGRQYTPISLLECDNRRVYNVIGLIMTDNIIKRSLSGDRDWKITVGLTDVEQSKDPYSRRISFNLFASTEAGLPQGKVGAILLLRGIKVRSFNDAPQGSGYRGEFDWAWMDTSENNIEHALHTLQSTNGGLLPPEKWEMIRLYHWFRKHNKGARQAVAPTRTSRPRISISDIERQLFFDTTVEVVKIWDQTRPFEIYVTDYTSHPLLYAANDVHLNVQSRNELQEQQDECNDAGNGRVLPVSLWDDQEENVKHVGVGMLVHLENVRVKMQPNNYLGGTMGGGSQYQNEKLRVILVRDKGVIEEFKRRKEDYIEEVALRRAEKLAAVAEGGESDQEAGQHRLEELISTPSTAESPSSRSFPSGMPPPGQRPLSVINNQYSQRSALPSSSEKSSESHQSQEVVAPTSIEDSLRSYPISSIEDIHELSAEQLKLESVFVCQGRVFDMLPKTIDEIVKVTCGLCKTTLPVHHAFCARCSEEDGKDLHYSFNFALCIGNVNQTGTVGDDSDSVFLPVVVRGEDAKRFLHGFLPKDVRNRTSTMDRLKKRLLPILGSQIVYGHEEQKALPLLFAMTARGTKQPDGSIKPKYYLTKTRLDKESG